jgi:hypothetical protein
LRHWRRAELPLQIDVMRFENANSKRYELMARISLELFVSSQSADEAVCSSQGLKSTLLLVHFMGLNTIDVILRDFGMPA